MGRLSDWSREKVAREFARSAAAGHEFGDFQPTRQGQYAACSCGWQSTPRGRKVATASAAYWHVLEVCAALDDRRRLDLVEWSDAPSAPALRHGVEAVRQRREGADTPSG